MMPCKRAAELISQSLDGKLTFRQRLALAWHLCLCRMCRRFRRQAEVLQQAGRQAGQPEQAEAGPETALSEAARERIKQVLRQQPGQAP
jgi:hypothetical protein